MTKAESLLTEQRERYAKEISNLEAQKRGVESKIVQLQAKIEATTEAINAIALSEALS